MIGGWRARVGLVLVVAAVASAALLPRLEIDNSLERWVGADADEQRRYQRFRETFGSDEMVLVAFGGRPLFEEAALDVMVDCAERLEQLPGVERVQGIPFVYRDLFGGEDVGELETEIMSTPFYTGLFVSPEGDWAGVLVTVAPAPGRYARQHLMDGVHDAVRPLQEHGFDVDVVGSTALIVALDDLSSGETRRTLPVALAVSLLVLALALRSLRAMVVAATCSGLTVLLLAGLVAVSGRSLNMITVVLPSLVWVLALSNVVHIIQRFRVHTSTLPRAQAVRAALAETTRPCVLAALTTAAGFSSLLVAGMAPVRELGAFAAAGILLSLVVNLTVGPLLLVRLGARSRREAGSLAPVGVVLRRPWTVTVLTLAAVVAAMMVVPRIRVESNPLGFLPAGQEIVAAYGNVGERLTGFYTMEVVVRSPEPWWHPATWPVLEHIEQTIERSEIVARVLDPLDVLRKLRQWRHGLEEAAYRLPASGAEAESLLADLDRDSRAQLETLVAPGGQEVRLSAIVKEMDEGRFLALVEATRGALSELPEGFQGEVTGQVLQLVLAQQRLVNTQVRSLVLALTVVFAAIAVGLGSLRYTVVALLPNVLPVTAAFAFMAVADIPLDAATVMMASVALGIAVDNTLHLLAVHDGERRAGRDAVAAAATAVARVAAAATITTVTAGAGFVALMGSAFLPVRYFGLLTLVALAVALVGDLVVLPALLCLGPGRSSHPVGEGGGPAGGSDRS